MVVAWASNSSSRSPKPMCASAVLGKSGLCYAQEFFRIAGHVLPQHVTVEVLPDRPIENHLGGVREMSLAVRVVRLMHQHPRPEDVDHGLGHGRTLERLCATAEAAHLHVFDRVILERRSGARDVADHFAEPDYPVREPAVADLGDASVDI